MRKKILFILLVLIFSLSSVILTNYFIHSQNKQDTLIEFVPIPHQEVSSKSINISGPISIYIGESVVGDDLYEMISQDLNASFPNATIMNDTVSIKNDSIVIGRPTINNITKQMVADGNLTLDMTNWTVNSYHISELFYNDTNVIVIVGKDALGDGYGVYWFIDHLLGLHPEEIPGINLTRSTNLTYRQFSLPFNGTYEGLPEMMRHHMRFGSNMMGMGSFLGCLNFDNLTVGDPYSIYSASSSYRLTHEQNKQKYGNFTNYLKQYNFTLFVGTDMFPYTQPIKDYLGGKFDVNDPKIWAIINASVFEIFSVLNIDAIRVRIGEGGEVGKADYTSTVLFRNVAETKLLITNLLAYIDDYNAKFGTKKFLLFRTWTIGIGEVGDLHMEPDIFHQVFDDFDNRTNLVLSIKNVAMDFFRYAPRNPTVPIGKLPKIIEFQAKREYEGFGDLANYLARYFQEDVQSFASTSNFSGVWIWAGGGGWYKGNTSYLVRGFYTWTDANVYAYSRLVWNHSANVTEITQDWVQRTLGNNSAVIGNFTQMLLMSEYAILKGLYIYNYAVTTFSLDIPGVFSISRLPNMLWIYWNIPTSSHAMLTAIYSRCRVKLNVTSNVQDGFDALNIVKQMSGLVQGFSANVTDINTYNMILENFVYQETVFTMLAWYRQTWLYYYDFAVTLNPHSLIGYLTALPKLKTAVVNYDNAYPPPHAYYSLYETHEMRDFINRMETYPLVQTTSRVIFFGLLGFFLVGISINLYYKFKPKKSKTFKTRMQAKDPEPAKSLLKIKAPEAPKSWYYSILNGSFVFEQSIINPPGFFKNMKETDVKLYSFLPIVTITLTMGFVVSAFNYFEYFYFLFPVACGFVLVSWLYFSAGFFVLGHLLDGECKPEKALESTQYLFIPVLVFAIVIFGIFSITGPEALWYYLVLILEQPEILVIPLVSLVIVLIWTFIIGLFGISRIFKISLIRSTIIIIITMIPVIYLLVQFVTTLDVTELIVWANDIFDLITSIFNATETGASQLFG